MTQCFNKSSGCKTCGVTVELGEVTLDPTLPSVVTNAGNGQYVHTSGDGNVTIIETDPQLSFVNNCDGTVSVAWANGGSFDIDICKEVAAGCNTAFVVNPDGTYTFTDNAGVTTNGGFPTVVAGVVNALGQVPDGLGGSTAALDLDGAVVPVGENVLNLYSSTGAYVASIWIEQPSDSFCVAPAAVATRLDPDIGIGEIGTRILVLNAMDETTPITAGTFSDVSTTGQVTHLNSTTRPQSIDFRLDQETAGQIKMLGVNDSGVKWNIRGDILINGISIGQIFDFVQGSEWLQSPGPGVGGYLRVPMSWGLSSICLDELMIARPETDANGRILPGNSVEVRWTVQAARFSHIGDGISGLTPDAGSYVIVPAVTSGDLRVNSSL